MLRLVYALTYFSTKYTRIGNFCIHFFRFQYHQTVTVGLVHVVSLTTFSLTWTQSATYHTLFTTLKLWLKRLPVVKLFHLSRLRASLLIKPSLSKSTFTHSLHIFMSLLLYSTSHCRTISIVHISFPHRRTQHSSVHQLTSYYSISHHTFIFTLYSLPF